MLHLLGAVKETGCRLSGLLQTVCSRSVPAFPGHPGIWRRNAGVRANTQWMGQRGKEMCEKEMLDPIFKSCLFFMLSREFLTGSNINIIIPK